MLFFTQTMFSAEKIYIADILCFDSKGERYSLLQNPAIQIKKQLMEKYYDGLIEFENVHVQRIGETSSAIDASKACINLGCQYLLYGYVRKNTNSWVAELKLFNKDSNSVIYSFFASDDVNHYERLLSYISENIYEVCLEKEHLNMVVTKIIGMLARGKVKKIIFATVDKSPHCVQLHYVIKELENAIDISNIEIINYVAVDEELVEIPLEVISLSKNLSKLKGKMSI